MSILRKIHGVPSSPYVRKIRVMMAEKGLEYDLVPVFPFGAGKEFRKLSPLGKIPVLEEDGYVLPDSSAIAEYLEAAYPDVPLFPKDPKERGTAVFLEEFGDSGLAEKGTGAIFFQRIVAPRFLGRPTDEEVVARAIDKDMPRLLDYLEGLLADGRQFLVGGAFSIADIAVATQFVNMKFGGYIVDAARWPKTADYIARIHGRPSFAKLVAEEEAMFAG